MKDHELIALVAAPIIASIIAAYPASSLLDEQDRIRIAEHGLAIALRLLKSISTLDLVALGLKVPDAGIDPVY